MRSDKAVTVKADLSRLEKYMRDIKSNYVARVGILGGDASAPHDSESGMTNSAIGLVHEFGSQDGNIPPRSFLRMPLETQQNKLIEIFEDHPEVKKAIAEGNTKYALKIIGFYGEQIVKDAFRSSGFGQWKPNAPATVRKKGSSRPLIDTGKLIASVSSDVVKKGDI